MNQIGSESEESGPWMAEAMERLTKTLIGKNATYIRRGDNQPARRGYTPSVITAARIRNHVPALSNTVKPNETPAPAIAANPAVTMESPLGRAIVTAHPS